MNEPNRFRLITKYGVQSYSCGICAGSKVRLKHQIVDRDHNGEPSGKIHQQGDIWTVLSGSVDDPGIIWLLDSYGDRCTWSDDSDFLDNFEAIQ